MLDQKSTFQRTIFMNKNLFCMPQNGGDMFAELNAGAVEELTSARIAVGRHEKADIYGNTEKKNTSENSLHFASGVHKEAIFDLAAFKP